MKNLYWLLIVIASIFEVGWATGLKYSSTPVEWILTIIAIVVSFGILLLASTKLPTSTVYAVFVGLGTVGTAIADVIFFGSNLSFGLVFFVLLLLTGVIGLKFATGEQSNSKEGEIG